VKRRKGLLDEEKFLPPLPEQLPRGVSSLPGYGQTSPVAQGLLGFTGRNQTYSVMDPQAQEMSDAYRLGEQASVASQLYGSVLPFAAASTMASAQRAGSLLSPLTVFHGSPHKFSKFDASKIGTGEGAQAYGHGLYFAESPEVANTYAFGLANRKLSEKLKNLSNSSDIVDKTAAARVFYDDNESLIQFIKSKKQDLSNAEIKGILTNSKTKYETIKNSFGNLYKTDLPDEQIEKMLDWDKPFSQQSKAVQDAINKSDQTLRYNAYLKFGNADPLGSDLMRASSNQQGLAEHLRELGVPGVRYLDQGSRYKGGTSNFVVFPGEESKLRIMEVNGRPVVIDEEELRRSGLLGP
jgi:hypothetical protein